jgi:hypothetical protein
VQAACQQTSQPPRRRAVARHAELAPGDRGGQREQAVAGEGSLAVQRLPAGDAPAELVAARVGRDPRELLGCHVRGRTEDRADVRQVQVQRVVRALEGRQRGDPLGGVAAAGQAEVHQAHAAVVADHDVVGLDVAVYEGGIMRGDEAAAGGAQHLEHVSPGAWGRREPGVEGLAGDELHRHPHLLAERAAVVHRDDVGMLQAGHRLGLAEEAVAGVIAVDLVGAQELEGDLAVELRIVGRIDDAHAPGTDPREDEIAVDRLARFELDRWDLAGRQQVVARRADEGLGPGEQIGGRSGRRGFGHRRIRTCRALV